MRLTHIFKEAYILQVICKGQRGNKDKRALVAQTHYVSLVQGATSEIGCKQSLTLACQGNAPEPDRKSKEARK